MTNHHVSSAASTRYAANQLTRKELTMTDWNPDRRYWAMHPKSSRLTLPDLPYLSIADDSKYSQLSPGDPIFVFDRGSLAALYQVAEICTWVRVPLAIQATEPASVCLYTVKVKPLTPPKVSTGDDPVRAFLLQQVRHALENEVLRVLPSSPALESMAWPVDGPMGKRLFEACQLTG